MRFVADKMGIPGAYFARRWMLDFGPFSVRLHHWTGSDDPDAFHDHGQWFVTLCLWGGYTDINCATKLHDRGAVAVESSCFRYEERRDVLRPGNLRFRPATYTHTVQNDCPNTWTLCIFGPPKRRWSFFDRKSLKRLRRDKYFATVGHHTADGSRIRLRPDGSQIS